MLPDQANDPVIRAPQDPEELRPAAVCRRLGVEFIRGASESPATVERVRRFLAGQLLDWLFIDGWHSTAQVEADYRLYNPLVRPGGWLGFHDINWPTVQAVWAPLRAAGGIEFNVHCPNGWGGIGLIQHAAT